jgi:putative aminopeptidase FrvX
MADHLTAEAWLAELTNLPTAPGLEGPVVDWVTRWVAERPDLELNQDSGGNLFITQLGPMSRAALLAVAHIDHPAFVLLDEAGGFEFRGGVDEPYFREDVIQVVSRQDGPEGKVVSYDPDSSTGTAEFSGDVYEDDVAYWQFGDAGSARGRFRAPACDDLAGAAAALAALDRARGDDRLRHFGLMLTRAEEVGLIGAIHAAKHRTIPSAARLLSIETSRELPTARIGDGPIIRIGDRATVFDRELSNLVCHAVEEAGIKHQRKLMDGGTCEASAFGVYGYRATGLCLALGNWHNRGNLGEVEAGDTDAAVAKLEEISIEDFHGLVDLLLVATEAVDGEDTRVERMDRHYESNRRYLN